MLRESKVRQLQPIDTTPVSERILSCELEYLRPIRSRQFWSGVNVFFVHDISVKVQRLGDKERSELVHAVCSTLDKFLIQRYLGLAL